LPPPPPATRSGSGAPAADARGTAERAEIAALTEAYEQARRASERKSLLLAIVAHELRTPLTAFGLQLSGLERDRDGQLSPHQREVIGRMRASTRRVSALLEALLEDARIEAGALTAAPTDVDVVTVVRETLDDIHPDAADKGLDLVAHVPEEPLTVTTDARLLRIIVQNLVGNAVKFTVRGGVTVRVSRHLAGVRIAVRDTGPGIALEVQGRIFEAFEQLGGRERTTGVGLGLALVQRMSDALGGSIDVWSRLGDGSEFVVTLPWRTRGRA
jgi:signal transduction histidine kinase